MELVKSTLSMPTVLEKTTEDSKYHSKCLEASELPERMNGRATLPETVPSELAGLCKP